MHALIAILLALPHEAAADRYVGDDTSGTVKFDMEASLHEIPGEAKSFTTEISVEEKLTGKVVIQAKSLTTGIGVRDTRMYEFCLESDKFPTIVFEVRGATGDTAGILSQEGSGMVSLHGSLKVRSTSRELVIPTAYTWKDGELHLQGDQVIKWTDYGVPDPSIVISKLEPKMAISFDVNLHKSF